MIEPENIAQKLFDMVMNIVLAFRINVKNITDRESEPITLIALLVIPFCVPSIVPITIGKRGKMHGARIVRTPASIDIKNRIIVLNKNFYNFLLS